MTATAAHDMRNAYNFLSENLMGKAQLVHSKHRLDEDKMNFKNTVYCRRLNCLRSPFSGGFS
jgi:hypothetical protein